MSVAGVGLNSAAASIAAPVTVNGRVIALPGQDVDAAALSQRACSELLRQAAQSAGLLAADDVASADGVMSVAASVAIERLLEQQLRLPEPDDTACARAFAAHPAQFARGHAWHLAHILFAVTSGVPVPALAQHAQGVLRRLRDAPVAEQDAAFAGAARECSNCPSGQIAGDLGWVQQDELAPELARELLHSIRHTRLAEPLPHAAAQEAQQPLSFTGLVPRLLHSRFGFHIVRVQAHRPGQLVSLAQVRPAVVRYLQRQAWTAALSRYLQALVERSELRGVDVFKCTSAAHTV